MDHPFLKGKNYYDGSTEFFCILCGRRVKVWGFKSEDPFRVETIVLGDSVTHYFTESEDVVFSMSAEIGNENDL